MAVTLDPNEQIGRQRKEIDRLLETLRDGELNDAEADYIESLLTESAELRRYYIRSVALQIGLRRLSAGPPTMRRAAAASTLWCQTDQVIPDIVVATQSQRAGKLVSETPQPLLNNGTALSAESPLPGGPSAPGSPATPGVVGYRRDGPALILLISTIAALVAVVALLAWQMRPASMPAQPSRPAEIAAGHEPNPGRLGVPGADGPGAPGQLLLYSGTASPSATIARLTRAAHCQWTDPNYSQQPGDVLAAGKVLDLAAGVIELQFDQGVRVVLQGPARAELTSAVKMSLHAGKMTAEILRPEARGFQVQTPKGMVVDLGTEFGIDVTPCQDVQVHVFQGEVVVAGTMYSWSAEGPSSHVPSHDFRSHVFRDQGLRMEDDSAGPLLVMDLGETFIRTIEDADRDKHVVAYWRFEDHPVGEPVPHTLSNKKAVRGSVDSSFNGNDLFAYSSSTRPMFSADVPKDSVLQSGTANHGCLDNTQSPVEGSPARDLYTRSRFSHASPIDIQTITPAQWTIEASVKAKVLHAGPQTFVGRDGGSGARLAFRINEKDRFEIQFYDIRHRMHKAVADLAVRENQWYHLAAVSNGQTLRLYVDARDSRGYQLRATTALDPKKHGSAMGGTGPNAEWSVGRGRVNSFPSEWFQGWIDEVRISDVARKPEEFLFAPKDQGGEHGSEK
jgi:hypothetical protein